MRYALILLLLIAAMPSLAQTTKPSGAKTKPKAADQPAGDRRLSDEQKAALGRVLSKFANGQVAMESVAGDAESKQFADDFQSVFKASGWTVDYMQNEFAKNPAGLFVMGDEQFPTPISKQFVAQLKQLGIPVTVQGFANWQDPNNKTQFLFIVGAKPPATQP